MQAVAKERAIRTRSGCLTCRRRKKKCDETRCPETGGCLRCKNSGYECEGYPKRKKIPSMADTPRSASISSALDAVGEVSNLTSPLAAHVLDTSVLDAGTSSLDLSQGLIASPSSHGVNETCSIIGKCILLGQPICQACLSSIQPVLSPSDPAPDFSISSSSSFPSNLDSSRHKQVLHCLIGYYAVVVTCWIEGCHPHSIVNSIFFKELVQYLFQRIDHDEGLRLSIACCASGYIGGGQLSWPEDLKAIQEWTEILRNGATELVDAATTSSAPTSRPVDDGSDRLARHSYLDRHLSRHARYLYRMANKSMDSTMQLCLRAPNNILADHSSRSASPHIQASRMRQYNNLLLSAMSKAIFSWAEMSIAPYYQDFDQALQIVNTIFGGIRRIKLKSLMTVDTLGFAILVWADVMAAIARGTTPYFYLEDEDEQATSSTHNTYHFHFFNCPTPLLKCLSELARMRFDCTVLPCISAQPSASLPDRLARQASHLESTLNSLAAMTHPSTQYNGAPNCSEMTRLAAIIYLYTTIHRKGPLHPTIKYCLQCILNLWQYGAKAFCIDVGCTNYIFSIFMAASVAHEARDRVICEEAMNLVGHDEATADAGRRLIKEVWRRTDESGMPVIWSDVVKEGNLHVAFL